MLPAANRMRRPAEFTSTVRGGSRARGRYVVVHYLVAAHPSADTAPIAGLIVGRSVGGSVVRNRVSRRLRAQLAHRVSALPQGSRTVVRALPSCADASSAQLAEDLETRLTRVTSSGPSASSARNRVGRA